MPRPARRPGCASRGAALPCAPRGCRSCRAPSCSTCSTAATRTGAAIRPIANSATRRGERPAAADFALGSVGAGIGATTVNLKGGLGSASASRRKGHVSARSRQSTRSAAPWSAAGRASGAPFEAEQRVRRPRFSLPSFRRGARCRTKGAPGASTTLIAAATDATLTKAQAHRLAVMAQTGSRAPSIWCTRRSTATWCLAAATGKNRSPIRCSPCRPRRPRRHCRRPRHCARRLRGDSTAVPLAALPSWKELWARPLMAFSRDGTAGGRPIVGRQWTAVRYPQRFTATVIFHGCARDR